MSASDPRVSLIIAVYEAPHFLELILESLLRQTFTDFEIIVADDGSGPAIADMIAKYGSQFSHPILHAWQKDDGFRKTVIVNRAAKMANGEYLVFIDGDCFLHRRFIERHLARRDHKLALSGRRVMLRDELTNRLEVEQIRTGAFEKILFWWNDCNENTRQNGFYSPLLFVFKNRFRNDYSILGSNFSLYKSDFETVNGYDERIIGRGLEDDNLRARLVNAGIRIRSVANEAIQFHCFHTSDPIPHSPEFIREFHSPTEARTEHGIEKQSSSEDLGVSRTGN